LKTYHSTKTKLDKKAVSIITLSLKKGGNLAICGGRSVKGIFKLLVKAKIDWSNVGVYWVDERLVPKLHKESNYLLAKQLFLDKLDIPNDNIHYFNIDEYKKIKKFEVILLSAGEDGHVGALYPNHHSIKSNSKVLSMDDSPKMPKKRLTCGKKLLLTANTSILLFYGYGKRNAFKKFMEKKVTITDCPAKIVNKIKNSYVFRDS
jgi:6-phosphogluconolactonase